MKAGSKKYIANSSNVSQLQKLRNKMPDLGVQCPRWGGLWNGMNWEYLTFYATEDSIKKVKAFIKSEFNGGGPVIYKF